MDSYAKTVLLLDDEPRIRRLLHVTLKSHGYRPLEAATGREGIEVNRARSPSLVILDLGLPDMDGLDVLAQLRRESAVPVVVLSVRDAEKEKVAAFDRGADDYMTKPFGSDELLARVRVALRHAGDVDKDEAPRGTFSVGDLRVDFDRRLVFANGREVHLTPTEYNLLSVLIVSAGRVITHRRLLERVWGPGSVDQLHYLRVYMKQLRCKIEPDPSFPRYLITEPAVGYRLRVPPAARESATRQSAQRRG